MDKKNIIIVVVVALVAGGLGFFGGMKYDQSKRASTITAFRNGEFGGRNNNRGQNGGAFANGQIIGKDDKSVTIKMQDGSSKIVFLADSTQIGKSVTGAATDLTTGENVVVNGTANSDGSITAQNIQIRPAITNPPGR